MQLVQVRYEHKNTISFFFSFFLLIWREQAINYTDAELRARGPLSSHK